MQIDKYFSTPYEGYFVSKDGEVVSFRKPAAKSTPDKRIDYLCRSHEQEPTGQQGREP